jgi:hypothetical protein
MRPVRDLFGELVERRLWPIALVLVLALVAVPVLLAKSPEPVEETAPTTPPVAAAASAPDLALPSQSVVSVTQAGGAKTTVRGRAKNPFRQQHVPPDPTTVTSTSTSTATAGGSASDPTGQTAPGGSGGSGGGQLPPAPPTYVYSTIDVRFGPAGTRLETIEDVPRLTPLPRTEHPVAIFLGMRDDRETAVFMISTDVHVQGIGHCEPSRRLCEAVELKRGEVVFLDYTNPDETVTQYELELADVVQHETTDEAKARLAYAKASRKGRRLLRRINATSSIAGLLRYSKRTGVVTARSSTYMERARRSATRRVARPHASTGSTASAPVLTPLP